MRVSLKVKAAAAITLLFLGMMALIASVQTRFIRADLMEVVTEQQSALVARAAKDLDQKLETHLLVLSQEAMAIPPEILARPQSFRSYLERQPSMLMLFDALLIISPAGEVLADVPEVAGRQGIKIGDREYFKRSIATRRPVISAPYLGRAVQRPMITMTAPILDADGRLAGFLGGTLDLMKPNFLGGLAISSIGKAGFFFVITKDQPSVYVVHPRPNLILTPSTGAGSVSANERALAGQEGTFEAADDQSIPGLFSYKSLTTANWLLATDYPLAEALAPVVAAEQRLWLISAVLATLLAPLVWLLTWYLIAPLLRLRDDVQKLRRSAGVISPDLRARQDEIGDLARDFNALIAERQQGVEALRRSTQLLDNIVENIPVAIQLKTVNDDFRFVMWNKAAETMFGLPRERMIGRTAHDMWSPEDIARIREADLLAVASNGQEFIKRPAATAHRGTILTHMRKVPLFDADGVATHLLVIADDITDRVAADARLAQSEASLRGAAESALDAFSILDSVRDAAGEICDFRFRFLNAKAERLLSKPAGQAVGQLLCELFPTERSDGHFEKYAQVVKTGIPLEEEFRADVEGVNATWMHIQVVRLEDGIAATTRDISARKAAEKELRSNRTFLQSLIDNLPMAISVKDVRPKHYGKMVVWNKGAEIIAGIPEQQVLGREDKDIFDPVVYREIEQRDREMLASPMVYDFPEHPFRRADGALIFLHTISVPLFGVDDTPEFLLRISEDVTTRRREQKDLRAKTAELLTVSDASPLGMIRTDAQGRRTYANRSYELISGLSLEEAVADGKTETLHPEDRDRVLLEWRAALRTQQSFASIHRYQHRDGRIVWASARMAPVVVDDKAVGYVGTLDDITDRRETEHALHASEHRLRTMTNSMPAWIAYVDRREIYRFTNAAFERAFDLTREQVQGRTIRDVVGEAGYLNIKPYLSLVFGGQAVTFEREQQVADGMRWVEATWIPEIDEDSKDVIGFHAMLRDITAQKMEEQRLLRLSQIDSLTGLANRVGFEQRLSDAMGESRNTGQALAVMYIDIDHFKQINDTHGHAAGDALLLAFAQRLRGSLRKTDMVARLGGDEFVVVMERMPDTKVAAAAASKALQAIRRPFLFADHGLSLSVTVSIGIAFFDGGPATAGQLVAEADAMLYAAKKRGRDNFCMASWPHQDLSVEATVH